ncbi:prepilin-type N-terminal cleavage/methylation domain-containing protein [Anaerostipes sp.]|uniref:prepilin-type N-terminal cleavage/methylation domain-containing protein n=1 Tax=Anaerostipes sp. TaxID=1872530 RepID=UPI0025C0519D|nr:prepilin-type N-terminal cleavage/methylation domain-containing protein [Anaerostipes sp.]MBS7009362.1 prepilin-type N-terminal cleavage/methylation domain-containing protein [Anaerostipes sp.]
MRERKDGFTLVELIVVLLILAILIALLVPSLTGYIRKAKEKAAIVECRNCVQAAQAILSEQYGETGTAVLTPPYSQVLDQAEEKGTIREIRYNTDYKVTYLKYTTKGKITVVYEDGTYRIVRDETGGDNTESGKDDETGGGVTITDSSGAKHEITASSKDGWEQKKDAINNGYGAGFGNGILYQDKTGLYASINDPYFGTDKNPDLTLADLAGKNPGQLIKIDSGTKLYINKDIENESGPYLKNVKRGDLCYAGGSYYIAPGPVGEWEKPGQGSWIKLNF